MRLAISLLTSAVTLFGMWAAGDKKPWAWLVGLGNQALWLTFIVMFEAWGLLPLCASLIVVYTRNHLRWKSEARAMALLVEHSEKGTCDAWSGYHDDGDPMTCSRVAGHEGDHAHHEDFTWARGTLASNEEASS